MKNSAKYLIWAISVSVIIISFAACDFGNTGGAVQNPSVTPSGASSGLVPLYQLPVVVSGTVYEVGPGKQYPDLSTLPVGSLVGGDLVKIYWRAEPYATKLRLTTQATQEYPLRIQGIPDANGNLPVISARNAVVSSTHTAATQGLGVITVCGSYGQKPSFIEIVNLVLQDGNETTAYTGINGATLAHQSGTAGIWIKADNVSVLGCVIKNNGNGLFSQATNNDIVEITTGLLVEGCLFEENGAQNSFLRHTLYTQGLNTTIQFCTIRRQAIGAMGCSIKDRSAGTVIRYNWIETSAKALDIVEPDTTETILLNAEHVDSYNNVYVYGNVIVNTEATYTRSGNLMFHFGGDSAQDISTYRGGNLWFYDNLVYINRNDGFWDMRLFDMKDTNPALDAVTTGTVQLYNNTIYNTGNSSNFCLLRDNGNIAIHGGNWITANVKDTATTNTAVTVSVTGRNNLLAGANPGFVDESALDLSLKSDAPGVIGHVALPGSLQSVHPVLYRYEPGKINSPVRQ